MVDLHTHVLFGIDDGARTIEDSLDILKKSEESGVKKMMLTPHFSVGDDVDEFLRVRQEKFEALLRAYGGKIELKAGSEVYITHEIFNEDKLDKLTLGDSRVILAEFKYHALRREQFLGYIDEILNHDVKILLAHPERYSYLKEDRWLMEALAERGVMLQINAISLFEASEEGEWARMMLKGCNVFAIGSDIHHVSSKRIDAVAKINESRKWDKYLKDNPDLIFRGQI